MVVVTEMPNSLPHGPRNVYLLEFLGNNVIVQSHDPPKRFMCILFEGFYIPSVHIGVPDFVNYSVIGNDSIDSKPFNGCVTCNNHVLHLSYVYMLNCV